MSQLNYYSLVWICHIRSLNIKIHNIHKRALRIVCQSKKSNLQDLLQKDKSVSIHMKNLQYLATEIYKLINDLCPKIMKEVFIFQANEKHNLRSVSNLANIDMHTTHFGKLSYGNLYQKK